MAGIFYLPRLFVHHSEKVNIPSDTDTLFSMMESKLLKVIMTPAMIATWGFGLSLAVIPGAVGLVRSLAMGETDLRCGNDVVSFLAREATARFRAVVKTTLTGKTYRIMNEVPTILLLVIVVMVVVRPF